MDRLENAKRMLKMAEELKAQPVVKQEVKPEPVKVVEEEVAEEKPVKNKKEWSKD